MSFQQLAKEARRTLEEEGIRVFTIKTACYLFRRIIRWWVRNRIRLIIHSLKRQISFVLFARGFRAKYRAAKYLVTQYVLVNNVLAYIERVQLFYDRYPTQEAELYLSTKRFLSDIPIVDSKPFKIAVFARKDTAHFLDPILEAIKGDFEIYRFYKDDPELFTQLPEFDILWLEWGTAGYLLNLLRDVPRGKCKIFVRIHDWELSDKATMSFVDWDVADKLIFVNPDAIRDFEKQHLGKYSDKFHLMPNAINEKQFAKIKTQFSKNILMCSESFIERKNYAQAIRLLRRIVDRDPEFHLYIKADPYLNPTFSIQCFEEVLKQNLKEHVHFIFAPEQSARLSKAAVTSKSDLLHIYKNSDIILSASNHEAFHFVVGEGMLCGLYPVVAKWEWGQPENIWGPYVAHDDDEIVERILSWGQLSEGEKERESQKARQYVINNHGLSACRRRFMELFPQLRESRLQAKKRVILFAHHHLYNWKPHGGEVSMARIMEYLHDNDYECLIVVCNRKNKVFERDYVKGLPFIVVPFQKFSQALIDILEWWRPDVALMWSLPARDAAPVCTGKGIPYILFVRYWHMVNPPPYHCLMTDEIDEKHRREHAPFHTSAAVVITNAEYVSDVVKRFFGVDSIYSYVPVEKRNALLPIEQRRYVTLINARKAGGKELVTRLANKNPDIDFLVIDDVAFSSYPHNVTTRPYMYETYDVIFKDTKVLLFSADDDGCGTGRVVFEAYYLGIPVLSVNSGGISEVIPEEYLISEHTRLDEWDAKLKWVLANYTENSRKVRGLMEEYSETAELEKVRLAVEAAINNPAPSIWQKEEGWDEIYGEFVLGKAQDPKKGTSHLGFLFQRGSLFASR
jgi:glycosyltransferase involved in cell wall biosynthesis